MRVVVVLVVIMGSAAVVGFYRGWFHVTSDRAADNSNVTVRVDKDKMQQDKQKAVDKVQDLGRPANDKGATSDAK